MRYMTKSGKGIVLGIAISLALPVYAQVSDASALILIFLKTVLFDFLKEQFDFAKKGTGAMVRQEAAGAIAIQEAIKQGSDVNAAAIGEAAKAELMDRNNRMFSVSGTLRIDGRPVAIGSTAPSACHQVNDATYLANARTTMGTHMSRMTANGLDFMAANEGANRARDRVVRDQQSLGAEIFDPSWITRDTLTDREAQQAERSIMYTFAPPPMPSGMVAQTPAAREVTQDLQRLQRQAQLPQRVMARQLALRSPINGQRSYLGTMQAWGQQSVEDPVQTAALGAKTDTGVLREIAITMKRQLAIESERLQAEHESNAMLALLVMREIRTDMQEIITTRMPTAATTKP